MKRFKYVGPLDSVDVPAIGAVGVTPNSLIEVEDPEISATLEAQPDAWKHIPNAAPRKRAAKKTAAAKKAAASPPAEPPADLTNTTETDEKGA